MKITKKLLSFISVAVFIFIINSTAFAQEGELSIGITPPILELTLNPGETTEELIKVSNGSGDSATLSIETVDFYYDENDTLQFITPEELEDPELQKFSIRDWIYTEETVSLRAGETKEVKVIISAPEDALPGGHYGLTFFESTTEGQAEGTAVGIGGQIGVMILVTIPGEFSKEGGLVEKLQTGLLSEDLKSFTPKKVFIGDGFAKIGPIDFKFKFQNDSASHTKPQGHVVVKNMLGVEVGMFSIYEKRVFPGTSRNLYARFEKDFLIGPYTAYLDVSDPEGNHHYSEVSFLAFPWKLMILTLLGIGIIIVFFRYYNKWIISRTLKKMKALKKENHK